MATTEGLSPEFDTAISNHQLGRAVDELGRQVFAGEVRHPYDLIASLNAIITEIALRSPSTVADACTELSRAVLIIKEGSGVEVDLVRALAWHEDLPLEVALPILRDADAQGIPLNEATPWQAFGTLASWASPGDIYRPATGSDPEKQARGLDILEQTILDADLEPSELVQAKDAVVDLAVRARRGDVVDRYKREARTAGDFARIGRACLATGQLDTAMDWFELEALEAGAATRIAGDPARAFLTAASQAWDLGPEGVARFVLDVEASDPMRGEWLRTSLADLVEESARASQATNDHQRNREHNFFRSVAHDVLEEVDDEHLLLTLENVYDENDPLAYERIARAHLQGGRLDDALSAYRQHHYRLNALDSQLARRSPVQMVADELDRLGRQDEALVFLQGRVDALQELDALDTRLFSPQDVEDLAALAAYAVAHDYPIVAGKTFPLLERHDPLAAKSYGDWLVGQRQDPGALDAYLRYEDAARRSEGSGDEGPGLEMFASAVAQRDGHVGSAAQAAAHLLERGDERLVEQVEALLRLTRESDQPDVAQRVIDFIARPQEGAETDAPSAAGGRLTRPELLVLARRDDEALQELTAAEQDDPDLDGSALAEAVDLILIDGRYDDAVALAQRTLDSTDRTDAAARRPALVQLARLGAVRNRGELVEPSLTELGAEDPSAWVQLGQWLSVRGRNEEAEAAFQNAVAGNAEFVVHRAVQHFDDRDRPEAAAAFLQDFLDRNPPSDDVSAGHRRQRGSAALLLAGF